VNRDTIGVNSLPKTVTQQCRGCDLSPGPSMPEFSTLTTRLPSHPVIGIVKLNSKNTNGSLCCFNIQFSKFNIMQFHTKHYVPLSASRPVIGRNPTHSTGMLTIVSVTSLTRGSGVPETRHWDHNRRRHMERKYAKNYNK